MIGTIGRFWSNQFEILSLIPSTLLHVEHLRAHERGDTIKPSKKPFAQKERISVCKNELQCNEMTPTIFDDRSLPSPFLRNVEHWAHRDVRMYDELHHTESLHIDGNDGDTHNQSHTSVPSTLY
jgi:hypothetical protein